MSKNTASQPSLFNQDNHPPISDMADVVERWLDESSEAERLAFVNAVDKDKLLVYHNTLGREIRNHFSLWSYEWVPEMRNGIDWSKKHPDQISQAVIEEVWDRRQND